MSESKVNTLVSYLKKASVRMTVGVVSAMIMSASLPYEIFAQGTANEAPQYIGQTLFREQVSDERRRERNLQAWLSDDTTPANQLQISNFQWYRAPESPNQPAGVEVVGPTTASPVIRVKLIENQPYAIIILKFLLKDSQGGVATPELRLIFFGDEEDLPEEDADCDGQTCPGDPDEDNDGIPDEEDGDCDGDGTPNDQDGDVDGDGTPNDEDEDMDGDGVPNDEDDSPGGAGAGEGDGGNDGGESEDQGEGPEGVDGGDDGAGNDGGGSSGVPGESGETPGPDGGNEGGNDGEGGGSDSGGDDAGGNQGSDGNGNTDGTPTPPTDDEKIPPPPSNPGGGDKCGKRSFKCTFGEPMKSENADANETVFNLGIQNNLTLTENLKQVFYPTDIGANSPNRIRYVLRVMLVGILVVLLIRAGAKMVINADDEGELQKSRMNILYIVMGIGIILLAIWILSVALNINDQSTIVGLADESEPGSLLNKVENNIFQFIGGFLKGMAFFVAIVSLFRHGYNMMMALDTESKATEAKAGVQNVVFALIFIKLIDYLYYIAQMKDFKSRSVDFIVQASKFLGYVFGVAILLAALYAGYLMITAGGDESRVEKGKNILKTIFVITIVVLLFLLVVYQVFVDILQ